MDREEDKMACETCIWHDKGLCLFEGILVDKYSNICDEYTGEETKG